MRIPRATYRLQFNAGFGFRQAKAIVPYLSALGISDLYASPIMRARTGSLHGYDVVDSNHLNPELGTEQDFEALRQELNDAGMTWLQDIVPNHMAFDSQNTMLMDVLENGEASAYHQYFDIEWNHHYESIRGRVLAPFLGTSFGEALEDGDIRLEYDLVEGFRIRFYENAFPLRGESYGSVLTHRLARLRDTIGREHPDFIKYLGVIFVFKNLPGPENRQERYDQISFAKRILRELTQESDPIRSFLQENVQEFNGEKGHPESFALLDGLLSEQLFRLAFWKVASEEINYRRFFYVNELMCLRVEDEAVFNKTHQFVLSLVREKRINGLRVDHIDGLYDPTRYLARLRETAGDVYIVVEKILDQDEQLPSFWPVQGTTGYDFTNHVNGLFIRRDNERSFTRIYASFLGFRMNYREVMTEKKNLILGKEMGGDVDNLAHLLRRISSLNRYARDITLTGLKRGLMEVMARFPVYRTYFNNNAAFREMDIQYLDQAINRAISSNPGLTKELRFIERFLKRDWDPHTGQGERDQWMHFVLKFQQTTGPLTAKGFEDTLLYVYNRFLSLNEVGGNPDVFGITLQQFHRFCRDRSEQWPHTMNTTSTHDSKRGEDVRSRLDVISEVPELWEKHVKLWGRVNQKRKRKTGDILAPDRNDEYFLYQTLVGAFPFSQDEIPEFSERIKDYCIKAIREAKVHTGWLKPDTDYEEGCTAFIEQILEPSEENLFLRDFIPFQQFVARYGIFNSLSQVLVKMTTPGVPDFYQGSELWDLSLVDPDNRRPVQYQQRSEILENLATESRAGIGHLARLLLDSWKDGRVKLFLIWRTLQVRQELPQLFESGTYLPLSVSGRLRNHIIAFGRRWKHQWAVVAVPRFFTSLVGTDELPIGQSLWADTSVRVDSQAPASWQNRLTGETVVGIGSLAAGELFNQFPAALLTGETSP
nr:malto-oligosyltrehalose synthase [Deltaproteobacteria bacterium]